MLYDALGYYKILEVDVLADDQTIKLNYRDKAKQWHPDHNKSDDALDMFQKISVAYDILKDHKTRTIYDMLSIIYTQKDFPDFQTLKIYKDHKGIETPFLRVLRLYKYTKQGFKLEKPIVSYDGAIDIINKITTENWIKGWIKPNENFKIIKYNRENLNKNIEDNFKMFVHNAVAYFKEDKKDKAYICAVEALSYANNEQKQKILNFLHTLPQIQYTPKNWNYEYLKQIQMKIPKFIISVFVLIVICVSFFIFNQKFSLFKEKDDKINYYQEVVFNNGNETVDDMILSKIFNIPVDYDDDTMLFHITSVTNIMHGPSENFDILYKSSKNQTVRVTGYTPDKQWYRVLLDDGNMGFVKKRFIKKGIGNTIPNKSKIIKNTER